MIDTPAWRTSTRAGSGQTHTFTLDPVRRIPAVHLSLQLHWWVWASPLKGGDVCSVIGRDLEQEFRDRLTTVRSQVEQESDVLLQQVERERGTLQEELWLLRAQEAALQEELTAAAQVSSPPRLPVRLPVPEILSSQFSV